MGKARLLILTILCIFSLDLIGYTNQARAADWDSFGGAEFTNRGEDTQYLGLGITQPVEENWWLLGRVMGLHVDYKFEVNDDTLEGELTSVTPYLGIRRAIKGGGISLLGGPDIEWVTQETQDGPDDSDHKLGVAVQGEFDTWWDKEKNVSAIASYKSTDNFFWGRLRGKRGTGPVGEGTIFLGMEAIGMGNEDFASYGVGGFVEFANIIPRLSFGLKIGFKHSSSFADSVYEGMEVYYNF
jgi:hypothetical protein